MNRAIRAAAVLLPLAMSMGCSKDATPPPPHVWTVQGIVTNAVTSLPITGATATLFAGSVGTPATTDANGFFSFANVNEGTDVIVTLSATGFLTTVVHANSKYLPTNSDAGLVAADLIDASAALTPNPVAPPAPTWTVQGVVTDSATGAPIAGVAVSLSNGVSAAPMTATTGANGVYSIADVASVDDVIVQFSKALYNPASVHVVGPSVAKVVNVSAQLTLTFVPPVEITVDDLTIQGWVYASAAPAANATVWMWDNTKLTYVVSTKTDAAGKFTFAKVKAGNYELRVLPFDADANGVSDYRLFCLELGQVDACVTDSTDTNSSNTTVGLACSSNVNLTNLVIQLDEKSHTIAGGSFVRLSTASATNLMGYPITGANLLAGVTGVLQDGTKPIFLHFGSEVDTSTVDIQLLKIDFATLNAGTPVAATLAWQSNVILTITPGAPLAADMDGSSQYQLRFNSLRFRDGTQFFDVAGTDFGKLSFDVQALTAPLADPTPTLYVADQFDGATPLRGATKASVDSNTVWLLDDNGDFLFGYAPASHWTNAKGIQLNWRQVAGAAGYKVYGRNTSNPNGTNADALQWLLLNATIAGVVDPNLQTNVLATGVMKTQFGSFGKAAGPFSYGNGVEIAVTSVDRNGFESPIDTTKTLTLKDQTVPFLTAAVLDANLLTNSLAKKTESGNSFARIMDFTFSENMNTALLPTIGINSGNLTVGSQSNESWNPADPNAPIQDSNRVALKVNLKSRGVCTELLIDRLVAATASTTQKGDTILPVRDPSYFSAGASQSLVFLNAAGLPSFQVDGIASIDAASGELTLNSPMSAAAGFAINKGTLVCSLATSAGNQTTLTSVAATGETVVGNSSMFYFNESILVIKPGAGITVTGQVVTVQANDTVTNTIRTNPFINVVNFPPGSLIIPLPTAGGEYAFRGEQDLVPFADLTTGGAATDVEFAYLATSVMVGDQLFIDRDGNLNTTDDQAVVTVAQVRSVLNDPVFGQRLRLTVDLPANVLPLLRTVPPKVTVLGDSVTVTNVADTSGTSAAKVLNPRQSFISGSGTIR